MAFWTDKEGKKLTYKEFIERWKAGIEKVTLKQQLEQSFYGYGFVVIGIILGLFFTFRASQYWLGIILIGSLIITAVQLLGQYQKYLTIVKIYNQVKNDK